MRFYGGTSADWLGAPAGVVHACMEMLPRLQSEECLAAVMVSSAGALVSRSRTAAERASAQLRRWDLATQGGLGAVVRQRAPSATPEVVASMGVGVRIAPGKAVERG